MPPPAIPTGSTTRTEAITTMSLCILLAPLFALIQDLLNGVFGLLIIAGIEPPDLLPIIGPFFGCS